MTKRSFEALAKYVSFIHDMEARRLAAAAVAAACSESNPRFDIGKFYVACGVAPYTMED